MNDTAIDPAASYGGRAKRAPEASAMAAPLARFLAPLWRDRNVHVLGSRALVVADALDGARHVAILSEAEQARRLGQDDLVLALDAQSSWALLDLLATGVFPRFACALVVQQWREGDETIFNAAFAHRRAYVHRLVQGWLFGDLERAASQITPLAGSSLGAGAAQLWIGGAGDLPPLTGGLFEGADALAPDTTLADRVSTPAPTGKPQITAGLAPVSPHSPQARALAQRLLKVEARTLELRRANLKLAAELAQEYRSGAGAQSYFDAPKTAHPWPLADDPTRDPDMLGLYDRRVDDPVIHEALIGSQFFSDFKLQDPEPDYAAAVASLNATAPTLVIADEQTIPDASIVIPVYGQLPYTLNCIDSLIRHASRYSVEIIIVDDCSPDQLTAIYTPQVRHVKYVKQKKNGGFISSCNLGGSVARGRHVIMLNNDTRVAANWLDAMLDSFDLFPKAGLIGSKMFYPDGVLQEAGGIIWRDGSAWNYGRNDDPNRPQYSHAREVDYISGCSLALRRDLWDALGGFDPHFTPAYAEDADLCQRVADRGLEVWFQPQSRVIHYEGKTSGVSTGGGVKAYQVINLKKLFVRWRERFETHRANAEAPFFERERKVRKRMLFVDAVTPTPNQDAGSVQTVLGIACSRALGYKPHFVPQDNWLFEPRYTEDLQRSGVDCAYAPYEIGFENYIRRYGRLFDVIMVYRVGVMADVVEKIRQYAPQAIVLFHVADLHFLRTERQARLESDEAALAAAASLKTRELDMVRRADCTITHSSIEAQILADETPEAPVVVWPLMIEEAGRGAAFAARRDVVFLGGYRHTPNVDAVIHFVQQVLPLLKRADPSIRFIVAGANPTPEVLELACEDVIVPGLVEDLGEVLHQARVFVCPLRVGAGAKGKVMSALTYGVPVVSTAIGVEGAGLEHGRDVLVADEPQAMADTILQVYRDEALWRSLSERGREIVARDFSVEMGRTQLSAAIERAYAHKLGLDGAAG